jgi:hypothetical protein
LENEMNSKLNVHELQLGLDDDRSASAEPRSFSPMNIVLWAIQAVLALLYLSGGAYKIFSFDEMASQLVALPRAGWSVLGAIELGGAVLLVVPAVTKWRPVLTPLAAGVLALETLGLAALYASYSTELAATNPMVWALVMGLLAAFVAYGRYRLRPLA